MQRTSRLDRSIAMTESTLSVGILGVGNIGTVHLQSAQSMPGVSVPAVADAAPEMRGRARSLGVDVAYSDYHDLLAQGSVDAVVVALPPSLHAEATIAAVERGCHVFVEKPFAPTLEAAQRMVAAAREADVSVGVDHTVRYQPDVRRLKRRFDSGALGHVPLCVIERINNGPFGPPPANEPVAEGRLDPDAGSVGAILDLGVHLFDVLEWFFGEMEVRQAAITNQLDLPFEDTATVQLEAVETGTLATLNCGFFQWETPPDVTMNFRLHGVAETAESREYVPSRFPAYAARSAAANLWKRLAGGEPAFFEPTYYYQAHFRALQAFLEAVGEGVEPPVTGRDGRRSIELAEAAYRAAETSGGSGVEADVTRPSVQSQ